MTVKVYTRSMNPILYRKAMALCDLSYEKVHLMGTNADSYLFKVIQDADADWVVNIDEDAFISNREALESLLEYCIENNYVNCGMPDGGVVHLRDGNPLVTNPFFNILNVKTIREQFDIGKLCEAPDSSRFTEKSLLVGSYDFCNTCEEPYYPFFIWMSNHFKTLYLKATDHADGESTVLYNHHDEPFLIHTWYSRCYNRDSFHTNRIDNAYREACHLRGMKPQLPVCDTLRCIAARFGNAIIKKGVEIKRRLL